MKGYFGLMMFLLLISGVFASFSVSSFNVSPAQVAPGQFGTVTFVVTNGDAANSVQGITLEMSKSQYIIMDNRVIIGDLGPGSTVTLTLPFRVDPEAPSGIYPIDISVYGIAKAAFGTGTESQHKKVLMTIKVVRQPALQLSLEEGQINEISDEVLLIKNSGGAARKIYIRIMNANLGFLNQDVVYVESVDKNVSLPVIIDARDANEGSQKIQFAITYEDELGNIYSETRELPISIKKESGDFIFTQTSQLITGKEGKMKLQLKNEGDNAQDIRLSITSNNIQLVGISEYKVGDLRRGEAKVFEMPMLANVPPGSNVVKFNIKWVENGQNRESTRNVPIKVSSDADVGVYFDAKPTPLYSNGEYTISVTVSNLGSYPIEATTATFSSDALQLLSIQPEQYIGGLNKDDFSSVQYKVRTKDLAPGTYPMAITVKYRDASGEWVQKTVTANVGILQQPAQAGEGIEMLAVVVIIAIAAVYWLFLRPKQPAKVPVKR